MEDESVAGARVPGVDGLAGRDDGERAVDRIGMGIVCAMPSSDCRLSGGGVPATAGAGGSRSPAAAESLVKRKRGRPARGGGVAKVEAAPAPKRSRKEEEDVCFICFDGGNLVLCDRRDCPKAYHPACIKRDESFFTRRVRWNCGWHLCNSCQRNALFMCYTCPYSLCKTCVKEADIACVRGNKGFCRTCLTTIMLIENVTQGSGEVGHVDFDDTSSWEYLFKVYWIYLKQKESLTVDELSQATNPWKGLPLNIRANPSLDHRNTSVNKTVEMSSTTGQLDVNNRVETNASKRRKTRKQPPLQNNSSVKVVADKLQSRVVNWASKELLEFVAHMKDGDTSILSQFDVQALLLEYIRKNNLRDPRRKCQIICDTRLESLFHKTRVGHFEMLKLLEYHFKDDSCASSVAHAAATDSSTSQVEVEQCSKDAHVSTRERKRQARKKLDGGGRQVNLEDYAAIDVHNMNLIYLRRSLMENLMQDVEKFHDKVVGSIVRIRISGNDPKQEMYRLVCVVGTSKATETYKIGERTTNMMLNILNLNKIEDILIDAISNQDFTEDECRRLRQSIKCGLAERMTVGEVQDKAIALQEVRVKDVLETEILKFNHLRDRASEMGHRKQLRECVEKLELLKSPEERQRRIHDIPEVHADPRMDPRYQSDEDSEQSDTNKQGLNTRPKYSRSNSSKELISPRRGDMSYNTRAKVLRSCSSNWEQRRNEPIRSHLCKEDDAARSHESSQSSLELETDAARILEELRNQVDPCRITSNHEAIKSANNLQVSDDASVASSSSGFAPSPDCMDLEKLWHYQDPSGKVQGPFCMLQLRKWNSSGYFPVDLRVWRTDESQDKSVLLTDALSMQYHNEHDIPYSSHSEHHEARLANDGGRAEHGGQPSINLNAVWTNEKPNEGCNPDLTDAVTCSGDEKKPIAERNNGQEGLDGVSHLPPREKQINSCVLSSAGGNVSDACPTSSDVPSATVDHNHKPESSDNPHQTPEVDNEVSECLAMETGQQFSASNASSHNSGPDLNLSSGALTSTDLPSPTPEPELGSEGLNRHASESKSKSNLNVEAVENKHTVTSAVLEHITVADWNASSGQIEFSDLPSQNQDVKNEDANSEVSEIKQPVTSHMTRQDSGTSWNILSNGIEFPVPVSPANQENEGIKSLTGERCVTSNITCQDIGISWTTTATFASGTAQFFGYSVHGKSSSEELDPGISSGASVKFGDVPCEQATINLPSCQFTDSSTIHADFTTSGWHDGPIEFNTLGDESVSDLLCEVEGLDLESLRGMLSPDSPMNFEDDTIESPPSNDCFSRLVGLSPPIEPGKHDAWSSTCDIQFPSHPMTAEAHVQFAVNVHDCSTTPPLLPSPATTSLASSKGLGSEDVKPIPLPMHPESFVSHGHLPASPRLSSMDKSMRPGGSGTESEMKLVDVSESMSHEMQIRTPELPVSSVRSLDCSSSPEEKAELNPASASANPIEDGGAVLKQEFDSGVDLPPRPPPAQPSSPSSPIKLHQIKLAFPDSNGGPGEKLKQAADSSTDKQEPTSQHPPTSLQPSTPDTSMDTRETLRANAGGNTNTTAWGTGLGTTTTINIHRTPTYFLANQGNQASQQPRYHGGGGRHVGPKDRSHHYNNVDSTFSKIGRPSWNWQSSFNGSTGGGGGIGGGYPRPPVPSHRGQRVCKFYESGYCKKGASCTYLHP